MKKGVTWINVMAIMFVLALMASAMPVKADDGLRSGFSKVRDWDKAYEGFSFTKAIADSSMYGGAMISGGDFFMSPRGIHVFESPGIIDMGVVHIDAIGEAPVSGYVEMATPIDGHSYVVRSNGKYGKFYLEETYDWLDPVEYGISWVYQTNGTRTFQGTATSGSEYGCTYEQYMAAYNKLATLMSQGKGDTPEGQAAYEEYIKIKECYDSGGSGTGSATTSGQTGTGAAYGCPDDPDLAYQQYLAAYNRLTYLMSQGLGDTPEAQDAYEQYARARSCYETGSPGTETPSTTTTTTTTTTPGATTTTPGATSTTPGSTTATPGATTTTTGSATATPGATTATTSTTSTPGQGMGYPPSQWTSHQNGQSTVSINQNEICISSMDAGGAWAEAQRSYGIDKDYTVELDFKVREQNNHFIEIFCDEYVFLAVDWGTSVVYHQPGNSYSLGRLSIGLEVNRWYKIRMDAHPAQGTYDVYVDNNKLATATGIFPPDMGHHYRNDPGRQTQAGNLIYIGDVDDLDNKGGNYDRGSACWRNISITIPASGATSQPTSTPAVTGTTLIADYRTVAPGGTVEVPIRLRNARNMGSLGFNLAYDPAVLQVVKVTKGPVLAPATFVSNAQQAGRIICGFATAGGVGGDGSVAVVEFRAVGTQGSSSTLTLSQVEATDTYGATVSISKSDGLVTIGQLSQGDINGDNKVNTLDALRALRMYVQLEPVNMILDMNQDVRVTPEDARRILELAKPK